MMASLRCPLKKGIFNLPLPICGHLDQKTNVPKPPPKCLKSKSGKLDYLNGTTLNVSLRSFTDTEVKNIINQISPKNKKIITTIDLSYNQLTKMPDLDGFSNLQTIILESNSIRSLNGFSLANFARLTFFDVSGNKLTQLTNNHLDGFKGDNPVEVDVSFNPLASLIISKKGLQKSVDVLPYKKGSNVMIRFRYALPTLLSTKDAKSTSGFFKSALSMIF